MIESTKSEKGFVSKKAMLLIVLVVIAIAGVVFSMFSKRSDDLSSHANKQAYRIAADSFIEAMSKKDGESSYKLLTDTGKNKVGSENDWQNNLNSTFKSSTGDPTFLSDYNVSSSGGAYKDQQPRLLTYEFNLSGAKWVTSLTVVNTKDGWKIDNLTSGVKK